MKDVNCTEKSWILVVDMEYLPVISNEICKEFSMDPLHLYAFFVDVFAHAYDCDDVFNFINDLDEDASLTVQSDLHDIFLDFAKNFEEVLHSLRDDRVTTYLGTSDPASMAGNFYLRIHEDLPVKSDFYMIDELRNLY